MARLLILYSTHDGHTAKIVHVAGEAAREVGWDADIWPCRGLPSDFSLELYDAAIVAAPVIDRRYSGSASKVVRAYRAALSAVPSAFLSVSWSATGQAWAPPQAQRERANARFFRRSGWRPQRIFSLGGAVLYTRHR